jgi:hypothetical protein
MLQQHLQQIRERFPGMVNRASDVTRIRCGCMFVSRGSGNASGR